VRYAGGTPRTSVRWHVSNVKRYTVRETRVTPDDLAEHLRSVIRLLKANELSIDFFQLLEDLLQWDHPDGHVQLRWARGFYGQGQQQSDAECESEEATTAEREEEGNE